MRMIDADARVTVQRFDPIDEEYYHDEMTVEQALDFVTDEGCPTTVPAIPVEWLEWRIAHANREGFVGVAKMLRTVRDWWNDQRDLWQEEKEQEAR